MMDDGKIAGILKEGDGDGDDGDDDDDDGDAHCPPHSSAASSLGSDATA